ncbi:hypothetical protein A605_09565 [Corynebacterium halotolerans YIM 70093 = DSM 44683]|uniref:Uncharacterized protein n=1 Tax=Corynebacterium halotolerans YIM 70093 = DSM 44683 TaxID=1121362 RepID=M1NZH7_9CORY|nr:hypothetical protein A605_09565 [Corynebacterium halotolerans YIM 70093 = DSM 44683]
MRASARDFLPPRRSTRTLRVSVFAPSVSQREPICPAVRLMITLPSKAATSATLAGSTGYSTNWAKKSVCGVGKLWTTSSAVSSICAHCSTRYQNIFVGVISWGGP